MAARQARDLTRRKGLLESTSLPGEAGGLPARPTRTSARSSSWRATRPADSAKQARERAYQAILPIRGKILNVEKARLHKVLENVEIQALISAIGTGIGEEFDLSKARYGKVAILADADVDGAHIRTLLLTFFFRHMRELIDAGQGVRGPAAAVPGQVRRKVPYLLDERDLTGAPQPERPQEDRGAAVQGPG